MLPCMATLGTGLMTPWCVMAARLELLGLTTSPESGSGSYPWEKLLWRLPLASAQKAHGSLVRSVTSPDLQEVIGRGRVLRELEQIHPCPKTGASRPPSNSDLQRCCGCLMTRVSCFTAPGCVPNDFREGKAHDACATPLIEITALVFTHISPEPVYKCEDPTVQVRGTALPDLALAALAHARALVAR